MMKPPVQMELWKDWDNLSAEYIRHKIMTSRCWAARGVVAIYNQQTPKEKSRCTTFFSNKKGFNSCDAFSLSKIAQWCIAHPGRLRESDWKTLKKRLPKYSGQLLRLTRQKG